MKKRKTIFKIFDSLPENYFEIIIDFVNKEMQDVVYGMFDKDGNEITNENDFYEMTRIQSPEWVLKNKKGNCVDQTNLEYYFFKENGVKVDIYNIEYLNEEKHIIPSHMFVVLENHKKFYWYEHAWKKYAGIYEYNSLEECLNDIKSKFCPINYLNNFKVYKINNLEIGSNPNKTIDRILINLKENTKLYYLSKQNVDGKEIKPSIPNNFLTEYGYADYIQERVCLFPTIEQALYNITEECIDQTYNVYIPEGKYEYYKPNIDEIPTVNITGETWSYVPVKMKKIGKIRVKNYDPNNCIEYCYGENKNKGSLQKKNYIVLEGSLIKDGTTKVRSIREFEKILKSNHPDWSSKRIYRAAEGMHKKELEESQNSIEIDTKIYYVFDRYGKVFLKGNIKECQKYIKEHPNEELTFIEENTFLKLPDSEIKDYFENEIEEKKGLKIEIIPSEEFDNCYEVNVIDLSNSKIIDQEICCTIEEINYTIESFKQQYKIKKVDKKGNIKK